MRRPVFRPTPLSAIGIVVAFWPLAARAHIGAILARAKFLTPPPVTSKPGPNGRRTVDPYTFATADASFTVSWDDGDLDPTGQFFFYYLDHAPEVALDVPGIEKIATPIPETAAGIYAGCSCNPDQGVVCPDAGAVRDCRNSFVWDTHALAPGTYWVIAINRDPPYEIYSVSEGPVRVSHGGAPPPAVAVVEPDGFGAFDLTFTTEWLATGAPPLTIDLSYIMDDDLMAGAAYKPLQSNVQAPTGPDGAQTYDWNIADLSSSHVFFLRVRVTDAMGRSTFSDSVSGLTVYHEPIEGGLFVSHDLSATDMGTGGKPRGCGCAVGAPGPAPFFVALPPIVFALVAFLLGRRARRD
jgi:hypothetical protein